MCFVKNRLSKLTSIFDLALVPTRLCFGTPQGPPNLIENAANMAPTWLPKWIQDGQKTDPKIDHVLDASWDRFLDGFWWILDAKNEAKVTSK